MPIQWIQLLPENNKSADIELFFYDILHSTQSKQFKEISTCEDISSTIFVGRNGPLYPMRRLDWAQALMLSSLKKAGFGFALQAAEMYKTIQSVIRFQTF